MKIQLEITEDEVSMISSAMREMADRRRYQSIEWGGESGAGARQETKNYYELLSRIDDASKNFLK